MQEPFLAKVLPRLIEVMGEDYLELKSAHGRIAELLTLEEESFLRTLKRGGNILSSVIQQAQNSPLKQITGEDAFKLKDTYGLPLEEILLIAKDANLQVNLDAFALLEEQAKETSRLSKHAQVQEGEEELFKEFATKEKSSEFVGYLQLSTQSRILAILAQGKWVTSLDEGEEGSIILNKTPFYAEKGGQIGDTGHLSGAHALSLSKIASLLLAGSSRI